MSSELSQKLTLKQKAFCDYYIESNNATESYKKAYSCKSSRTAEMNGCKLLRNTKIEDYINQRIKKIENNRIASATEVLEYLTRVMRGEEKEEVVTTVNTGNGYSEIQKVIKEPGIKDKTKASELLGKRYRLFVDRVEADVNNFVTFEGENDIEE